MASAQHSLIVYWLVCHGIIHLGHGFPAMPVVPHPLENGQLLVGGDMVFPMSMTRGIAQNTATTRWTNATVPYVMSSAFNAQQQTMIIGAMRKIEQLTDINNRRCVRFRPKVATDKYSILIKTGGGCSSHVGQNTGWTGQLELTLKVPASQFDSHCIHDGTIMHELLHTLGFKHEHQRPDRDSYLTVNYANIQAGYAYAFDKMTFPNYDTLGTPYDYNSVMHYGRTAFSANGQPTMIPKDPNAVIGSRTTLSPIDIQEIRKFYSCQ